MTLETTKWDVVDYLDDDEAVAAYVEAVLEDGDPALFAAALGDVARSRGMNDIAKETGLSRESLYKSLSLEGNPQFATVMKVIAALGLRLEVKSKPKTAASTTI